MRVALYARYSSDLQRAASIDDQLRTCRDYATGHGWTVVATYADEAQSGASLMRPGIQSLMRAAPAQTFEIVLAEALDRFSRDLEHTARLFSQLKHARVQMATVSDGFIGRMHIGLKGTMNALYLDDLADKTRRGLRGRIAAGRSGGGLCYGYAVVRVLDGEARGQRTIDAEQAVIVRRIFGAFVAGVSPKAIAKTLNAEGIAGPRGVAWSPSTIHGHASRGTGVLNNELYVGRLIWNRQRFVKDPDTGKRLARLNPPAEWVSVDVPDLRIVDDALWHAAKARQASTRSTVARAGIVRARRPKYLFSGLTKCGVCDGGFDLSSHDFLVCFNARSRGTCTNRRSIRRQDVEARVLRAMRERLLEPGAFAAFCEGFAAEMEQQRREHLKQRAGARRQLETIEREIRQIIDAIKAGVTPLSIKAELETLETRKATLTIASAETPVPALHPHMADVFRQKVATLAAGLEQDEHRDAARMALRGLLDRIVIPPGDALLQVVGNFGEMLAAAAGRGRGVEAVGYVGCGGGI